MTKFLVLITLLVASTAAIEVNIPSFAYVGESVEMKCNIGYASPLMVKSITWFKDGRKFYSYNRDSSSPISVINREDVTVNVKKSSTFGNTITLDSVDINSSGLYMCKIELRHPYFDLAKSSATLKVATPLPPSPTSSPYGPSGPSF